MACAIVTELDPFECRPGEPAPSAEEARVDGVRYQSRATRVQAEGSRIVIERERRRFPAGARTAVPELNVVSLAHLTPATLRREARRAGLRPAGTRRVPETEEHTGSAVVMLRG